MKAARLALQEDGDLFVVSLVRLILGVLLAISAGRALDELFTRPFLGDIFHLPLVPEWLVPSRPVYAALVIGQGVLSLLVVAGVFSRTALFVSAVMGLYVLLCDRLGYHNNRYALLLMALLLSFAPCERFFSLAWPRRRAGASRRGPLWAARLAQVQLSLIYLASGGGKLLDDDWRGGVVLADRLRRGVSMARAAGVPPWVVDVLSDPAVSSVLAKVAIATELFLAVALHLPRLRAFALWWGLMFHVTIELTSRVELFGWLVLTVYALFATPEVRERVVSYDASVGRQRRGAWVIRHLDWLCRFELRPESGLDALTVIDRDGAAATGFSALAGVARAVPLLFPIWFPLLVTARVLGLTSARSPAPS